MRMIDNCSFLHSPFCDDVMMCCPRHVVWYRGLTNLFNLIGIESPGLTASPAIGEYVADMVQAQAKL